VAAESERLSCDKRSLTDGVMRMNAARSVALLSGLDADTRAAHGRKRWSEYWAAAHRARLEHFLSVVRNAQYRRSSETTSADQLQLAPEDVEQGRCF
jgi:hypothetical protein